MNFKGVRIFDGESVLDPGLDGVVVEQGRITKLCPGSELPGDAKDLGGLWIIPGLIDAHVHLCLDPSISDPLSHLTDPALLMSAMAERASAMVTAGITAARDLGGGNFVELALRDRINRGEMPGPRLLCAGQPVTSTGGHCHFWGGEAADLEAARVVIERQVEHGVDLIKVMATGGNITPGSKPADSQFDLATLTAIVAAAKDCGHAVAAHCHGTEGIGFAAAAGVTTIEHCSWAGAAGWGLNYDAAAVEEMVRQGTWVSPTINSGWRRHAPGSDREKLLNKNFARLTDAGVRLIASTDAGIPNVFHHHLPLALPLFARLAGISNEAVLVAATSDCARALGLAGHGLIREGCTADMVFVDGDPLADLGRLATPAQVMCRGELQLSGVLT